VFLRLFQALRLARRRGQLDAEIEHELAFHLQMEIEQRVRRGMTPDEARRTALRDFGGVGRIREEVRDVRGATFWDDVRQDVRYGIRMLARSPGYALAAVLTLGLGIGANAAIFSVVNDVLLKPLPYGRGHELVRIRQTAPGTYQPEAFLSIQEVADYRAQLTTVQDVVEHHSMSFVLLGRGEPDRVDTAVVSANYFDLFRVKALYGRTFVDGDDDLGAEPVLVLSHQYWLEKFDADESVVGKLVQMNDKAHKIVGILPPIPQYPLEHDVYMPTSACPFRADAERTMAVGRRTFASLRAFARLRPGHTADEAAAEAAGLARKWSADDPMMYEPERTRFAADAVTLDEELTRNARPILLALLGATGLVLLISCANVANLSLARTFQRAREMAVRSALGAGRGRLARQLLVECTLVALAGGLVGLVVAWSSAGLLVKFAGLFTARVVDPSVDWNVLIFTLGIAIVTGLVFGTAPAFVTRTVLTEALKDGGTQTGHGARNPRLRTWLVVAQVTVCFALVVGAGLLLESLRRLSAVDLGYQRQQVLTAEVTGNWSRQTNQQEVLNFYFAVLDNVRRIPGVESAAFTNAVPLAQNIIPGERPIDIEGVTSREGAQLPLADPNLATDGYFETLGVPLVRGRAILSTDRRTLPRVAVINETMARLWGDVDPLGKRFTMQARVPQEFTVVGIVGDVRQYSVGSRPLAQFYTPISEWGVGGEVLVRTSGEPTTYVDAVKAAVQAVDPQVPVVGFRTLETVRADRLTSPRVTTALLAVFALAALFITIMGLAAVIATSISQRTREFGLRMALGANARMVLTMVVRQGLRLVLFGLAAGTVVAMLFGRLFARYLYEIGPTDPRVLAGVAALFVIAAVVACLIPARRATAIDPLRALRSE
jgi:predicted permease